MSEFVLERDLKVPMRDGTLLAADVYRPAAARAPALVERTPYDKRRPVQEQAGRFVAARGYAFIAQDVRGRHGSQGEWYFLQTQEGQDGFDTLAWVAAQPWCDGRVATLGLSYGTATQQALAVERPPALRAQYLSDGGWSYFHRTLRSGGAFELGVLLPYSIRMARDGRTGDRESFERELDGLRPWLERLPLRRGASFLRHAPAEERWFFDMLEHEAYDDYWRQPTLSMAEHVDRFPDLPTVCQTSWYGHHVWATLEKWRALRARGSAPKLLLIGPWLHGYDDYGKSFAGDVDFGADSACDIHAERLRFFDGVLKPGGPPLGPSVRVFVLGGGSCRTNAEGRREHGGRWRSADDWPLPGTLQMRLFLHAGGALATESPPPFAAPTRYRHDPSDPVPAIGGHVQNSTSFPEFIKGGAFDQRGRADLWACRDTRPLRERPDVRVFETEPLASPFEVVGPVSVRLWVSASAPDADIVVKLIDVHPDGFAMNLSEAILRLRFRNGFERVEPLVPGAVYEVVLEPQPIGNLFAAGHRIRLDVQSSHFPQWDVNQLRAEVAVFHDAQRPSYLELPSSTR
jgi:putative CocE/NonD family hydrolase